VLTLLLMTSGTINVSFIRMFACAVATSEVLFLVTEMFHKDDPTKQTIRNCNGFRCDVGHEMLLLDIRRILKNVPSARVAHIRYELP
jgi:hypothetical protein